MEFIKDRASIVPQQLFEVWSSPPEMDVKFVNGKPTFTQKEPGFPLVYGLAVCTACGRIDHEDDMKFRTFSWIFLDKQYVNRDIGPAPFYVNVERKGGPFFHEVQFEDIPLYMHFEATPLFEEYLSR